MIDDCPRHLAAIRLAECAVARARLADRDGHETADATLAAIGTSYYLARGLLDHAGYLIRLGGNEATETAISKGADIAGRPRRQLLPDRGADLTPAELRIGARIVTAPGPERSCARPQPPRAWSTSPVRRDCGSGRSALGSGMTTGGPIVVVVGACPCIGFASTPPAGLTIKGRPKHPGPP